MSEPVPLLVGTHSQMFHGDDVVCAAQILRIRPHARIFRTRDPVLLSRMDIRFDVGGAYNPPTDFDHHGVTLYRADGYPYSSCGLIAKHFKSEIFPSEEVFQIIDDKLLKVIDAIDNGTRVWGGYDFEPYTITDLINSFRPKGKEMRSLPSRLKARIWDGAFFKAAKHMQKLLDREINAAADEVEGRTHVLSAISLRKRRHVIELRRAVAWHKIPAVFRSDASLVLFPDDSSDDWILQSIPERSGNPTLRVELNQYVVAATAEKHGLEIAYVSPDGRFVKSKEKKHLLALSDAIFM